ncbi:MAG: hypothetical protein KGD64_04595 [Candidatus Heimdallarchaeota archaeon]|nr:hypothetical protein [Candidatus Heimdallarchaeota archaeon]
MEKIVVKDDEQIELSIVDGDLEAHDGARITVSSKVDKLVIKGNLVSEGDVEINGSLEVEEIMHKNGYLEITGDVLAKRIRIRNGRSGGSKLIVGGNLTAEETTVEGGVEVEKDFKCPEVKIMGSCAVYGNADVETYEVSGSAKHELNLNATVVDISGSFKVGGDAIIKEELEVSGSAKINGTLDCPEVEIGGSFACNNLITNSTDVSGSAKTSTAQVGDKLSVSGSYKCEGSIIAAKLSVSGSSKVGDDSKIEKLSVSGSSTAGDNAKFVDVKVSGSLSLGANTIAENINVSGSCNSSGLLRLSEKLQVSGSLKGDEIEAGEISVSGSLTCEIAKADLITISRDSRVRGKLFGGTIIIGDGARVEDITADVVELGKDVRAGVIAAGTIDADPSAKYTKG